MSGQSGLTIFLTYGMSGASSGQVDAVPAYSPAQPPQDTHHIGWMDGEVDWIDLSGKCSSILEAKAKPCR